MMSSANEEDPFLQVQQDVLAQLDSTRSLFTSYLRIRSLSTSPTSPELASARSDLASALESLAEDLADLVESVKAVESDPSAFGLSPSEITRRKRLVQDVGGEVEDMREELAKKLGDVSSSFKGKSGANSDLPDPSSFAIADGDDRDRGGEDYAAEFEQQQQLEMMREQDTHLDGVFQTVGNLRRQADDMGRELEEQREMLEVVDSVADRVGGRLQTGVQKLQYVMRRNEDRLSSCCIAVLIFVLIVLLVLLLIL
ncbi:t-SNARE affecting a late Golgi compartment protein 1 [Colletotrichum tanaceti]|uniref:t-SNARE affecting a late Golgi compartment protein 1 n=1 Tax=Colletotrichum tanaceti TaxID=1306861 RepID=A0A4U6XQQ1_9PEZI|nr:t-SNARE affecting a late Golgi compartment protein 1 [Colletotrichum tanaceti]TKW58170.1 t-SNARE affecting a late Golgi compartment protein 1 [Colletotrichum tanaceti]